MTILPRVDTWDTDDDRVSNLGLMLLLTTIATSASPTTTAASASTSTYSKALWSLRIHVDRS